MRLNNVEKDSVKKLMNFNNPVPTESNFFIPNYSGIKDEAKKNSGIEIKDSGPTLYPVLQRQEYPSENVITNFQTGHGFTKTGTGTQSDDTTDYIKGSQSLKAITNGAGAAFHSTVTALAPFDMTGRYPVVWIKVDDTSKVAELWFYMASANDLSARYVWKIEDDISQIKSNTWSRVTLSFSEATVSGVPDRGAIIALRVWAKDKAGGAITVNWGGWSSIAEPTAGVCSIVFDDGWESQYSEARKKMDEYGFSGTAYIIKDYIGTTNYMTLQNLKDLQNLAGWDISAHHQTNLTTLNSDKIEEVLKLTKSYLLDNGLNRGVDHFAYPNGAYDESTVLPLVKKYFTTARTIAQYSETLNPADYHKLRVLLIVNTTTTASIATAVDNARTNKDWLILVFHKVVTTATAETEYSIANFGTVIDDIAADGIIVKTVSDVIKNY